VTIFGDKIFTEVIKDLKMRSLGWDLIFIRGNLDRAMVREIMWGHRKKMITSISQREGPEMDCPFKACRHIDLGFLASKRKKKQISVV
jgi:hypothetical protein